MSQAARGTQTSTGPLTFNTAFTQRRILKLYDLGPVVLTVAFVTVAVPVPPPKTGEKLQPTTTVSCGPWFVVVLFNWQAKSLQNTTIV